MHMNTSSKAAHFMFKDTQVNCHTSSALARMTSLPSAIMRNLIHKEPALTGRSLLSYLTAERIEKNTAFQRWNRLYHWWHRLYQCTNVVIGCTNVVIGCTNGAFPISITQQASHESGRLIIKRPIFSQGTPLVV
jgi:hypothetical protein